MEQEHLQLTTVSASPTVSDIATYVTRTAREAPRFAFNNNMLRLLVFLFLAPFFLLVLVHSLVAGPLLESVEDSYERSSLDKKDVGALVAIEVPFFAAFCIVWLLGTAVTISTAASAYSGKSLSIKDSMLWIKSKYKKILNAGLYVVLLVVVFLVLLLVSVCFTALIGENGAALVFTWIIRVVAAVVYSYLASICALGLVVAVLEDDCHSALALEEAQRLLKDSKLRACILMLILTLLSIPISVLFFVTSTDDDDETPFAAGCMFMFVATSLFCFANFFTFLAFTLFYLECKLQCHVEKVEMQLGPEYCLVPIN